AAHWQWCAETARARYWSLCRWLRPYTLLLRTISRTGLATWISLGRCDHGHAVIVAAVACWSKPCLGCIAPSVHACRVTTHSSHRFEQPERTSLFVVKCQEGVHSGKLYSGPMTLGRLLLCGRRQRDSGLSREHQECQRLLEVEAHNAVGVAQIADRDVLPDVQIEITAPRREHEGAGDGCGPDDLVLDQLSDMLQHGIPVVAGLGERRIGVGAQQHRIGSIDADETQLVQGLCDGIGIVTNICGQRQDRVAGPLPDAADARGGIALENGTVLGVGDLLRGLLCRLPVGVVRAPLHVINLLTIKLEWNPQLDHRLDLALPREDALVRRLDGLEVPGADGGKADTARRVHVNHAPSGEIALKGARRLLFDIRPRRFGNRGKLAVKVIHSDFLL